LEIYRREKDKIHLIILDIIMPGIGGMRCLEGLQSIDPEVRVVIATGYTPEGEAGGYISKPYDMRELLRVVREALDK
jgi:DNA-binding NtrC family response regulator